MIVTPETLYQARARWDRRHGDDPNFERTVVILDSATTLKDITHPIESWPFGALHHYMRADFYNIIAEADVMMTFRAVTTWDGHLEIEIVNRGRLTQLAHAYSARRRAVAERSRSDADAAVANSAHVVAVAAGAAGVVAVIRNLVGIAKDSLDINRHLRDRAQRKKDGGQGR